MRLENPVLDLTVRYKGSEAASKKGDNIFPGHFRAQDVGRGQDETTALPHFPNPGPDFGADLGR